MTPQEFCASFPSTARAECEAAGELLIEPRPQSAQASEETLTVSITADDGMLSLEYRGPRVDGMVDQLAECARRDVIELPTGTVVRLLFTSADTLYGLSFPDIVNSADLVPGRINERRIETPAEAAVVDGELQRHGDTVGHSVRLRFVERTDNLHPRAFCAD
ncbi:hypothetical protein [Fulvimarina sp. MAC8]|uniref:hypothetical protein n=1 Tax=Fulvimarina sp. MAC8 TaxID=3162874 RepID=UPI0032EF9E93